MSLFAAITGRYREQDRSKASRSEEEGREPRQAPERLIETESLSATARAYTGPVAIALHVTTIPRVPSRSVHLMTEGALERLRIRRLVMAVLVWSRVRRGER